jgi:hypothetical protein
MLFRLISGRLPAAPSRPAAFVLALAFALAGALLALAAPARAQAPGGAGGGAAMKPPPRVLVLTFGRADKGELAPKVQGLAEEVLLDMKFPLVDESQLMAAYQLDDLERFVVIAPELTRMAELKARFGCEMIVVVQYSRIFQYEKEHFGAKSRYFKNDVRVKAIFPDTAEIVHSGGQEGTIEARQTELEQLVRDEVAKCGKRIYERWSRETVAPSVYQVVARGFDHDAVQKLEAAIQGKPGVASVVEREYGGKTQGPASALIEVRFVGTLDALKALLASIADPAVEVKSASANRIEVIPAQRMKVGFVAPAEGAVLPGGAVDVEVAVTSGVAETVEVSGVAASPVGPGRFRARVALNEGENRLVARARDGLEREVTAERRVAVDARPPSVRIISPAPGAVTNKKTIEVMLEAADEGGVAEVSVNGVRAEPATDGRWVARLELSDGAHELVAVALDRAGQSGEARSSLTIDSVPPRIDGMVQAVIEGRVDKKGVTLTIDGKVIPLAADGSFRVVVEAPAGGTVTVVATDAAGNRAEKVYRIGGGR